jgi:hypothetical protein
MFTPFASSQQTLPWIPSDNGLLAASSTLDANSASFVPTAGTLYLTRVKIRAAMTATNVVYIVRAVGVGASSGSFTGLYSAAGALLSGSADIGANFLSQNDFSTPLITPQPLTPGNDVWVAFLTNLATTQPTLSAYATTTFTVPNVNLAGAGLRCATNGTGLSALPASFNPASNVGGGSTLWAGLS